MTTVSFHFHGYQPGDLVRWTEPDPLKPPRFEERRSPVALAIGGERITGRNWTDAVLRAYGRVEALLERAAGAASVDIEPQTLAWLQERDPDAHGRILESWRRGGAGLVMTPPFHPILPHHHRIDREAMFDMMLDFYSPLLQDHPGPVGLWLPEAAYSQETLDAYLNSARRARGDSERSLNLAHEVHLVLDARQLAAPEESTTAWGRTGLDGGLRFAARDPGLSGDFAFGSSSPEAFVAAAAGRGADSLLVASDLESLLANPAQGERFAGIVEGLRGKGLGVAPLAPPARPMAAEVLDCSTWSDYDEHLLHGRTSDTRWTGIRRSDGAVVSRVRRDGPLSQVWKHAFTWVTEQVEGAVRRAARAVLRGLEVERRAAILKRLAVAYGRHLFRGHYRACGLSAADTDFERAAGSILRGKVDVEVAGLLARGYTTMLMGLRSDPRFWDGPDTRVTFQNVACLAQSLIDMSEACTRSGDRGRADRLVRLLRAALVEFSESYARLGLADLRGASGWETKEEAWVRALQSEVPQRSGSDVVRRAALFALQGTAASGLGDAFPAPPQGIVADTGHIEGEAHGEWANPEWCEHRE